MKLLYGVMLAINVAALGGFTGAFIFEGLKEERTNWLCLVAMAVAASASMVDVANLL